jgi:hypothetical protein
LLQPCELAELQAPSTGHVFFPNLGKEWQPGDPVLVVPQPSMLAHISMVKLDDRLGPGRQPVLRCHGHHCDLRRQLVCEHNDLAKKHAYADQGHVVDIPLLEESAPLQFEDEGAALCIALAFDSLRRRVRCAAVSGACFPVASAC